MIKQTLTALAVLSASSVSAQETPRAGTLVIEYQALAEFTALQKRSYIETAGRGLSLFFAADLKRIACESDGNLTVPELIVEALTLTAVEIASKNLPHPTEILDVVQGYSDENTQSDSIFRFCSEANLNSAARTMEEAQALTVVAVSEGYYLMELQQMTNDAYRAIFQ